MIYLDYSATTPLDPDVAAVIHDVITRIHGNPSSIHSFGREAKKALEEGRRQVASALHADPGEIYFTGSGTEADNWAVKGFAREGRKKGKNHVITSAVEHHAILNCCEYLKEEGYEVTILPVDRRGLVDPGVLEKEIRPSTALISIMHVNNEVGSINDIARLASIASDRGIPFHSDTVQSFGKLPIDTSAIPVAALSISAHKIYGPKGIGALYLRRGGGLESLIHGGGQEKGRRGGTENIAYAAGFGAAAQRMLSNSALESPRIDSLRTKLLNGLSAHCKGFVVNTPPDLSLGSILNISFDTPIDGEVLLMNLDLEGLAVSNGSACTSGSIEPSHVLQAMGLDEQHARAAIRFSLGKQTTAEEIDEAVEIVGRVIEKMRDKEKLKIKN